MVERLSGQVLYEHTGPGGVGITSPDMMMVKFDPSLPGDRVFSIAVRSANSLKSEVVLLTPSQMIEFALAMGAGSLDWAGIVPPRLYPGRLGGNE